MKLRFFAFIILILFFPVVGEAQKVLYSPYQPFDFRTGGYSVIGRIGERIYVYRSTPEGFFLDAYNESMDLTATVLLDFFPQKISETKFISYDDKMIVLYQWVDNNKIVQSAALLDGEGRLLKKPVNLATEKRGMFNSNKEFFSSAVADNRKHIVIYGVNEKRKEIDVKAVWVDDELTVQGTSSAKFSAENELEYGKAEVDNQGTVYMSAYTPIGSKGYTDQIWLLTMHIGDKKFVPFEVPLGKMYAGHAYSQVDNNNSRVYIGGFYSDRKNGNYEGVLYCYFDMTTGTFKNYRNIPFDEKTRNTAGESNKRRAFNDYQIRKLIVKNDGGFIMIAEDYYVSNRTSYAPGFGYYSWYYPMTSTYVREYHYEDILVMSYAGDGSPEWTSFVRKNQYSQEDGGLFSSYAFMNTGGALGFLFNDFNERRSRMQLATVDASGKISVHALDAGRNDDPDWLPRSSKQTGSREIIIPCLRKRQICFAKVIF